MHALDQVPDGRGDIAESCLLDGLRPFIRRILTQTVSRISSEVIKKLSLHNRLDHQLNQSWDHKIKSIWTFGKSFSTRHRGLVMGIIGVKS